MNALVRSGHSQDRRNETWGGNDSEADIRQSGTE